MAEYTVQQYRDAARRAYEAGNMAAAEEIAQAGLALQAKQGKQEERATTGQLAGGLAAGLARGLADVPALPVNLLQLGTLGVEKLLGMEQPSAVSRLLESLPETRNILPEAASYVAPGRAGQFASTIGEFAGGAAGTFGAGAGVSALRAGTRGAAPLLTAAGKGMVTPDVLKYGVAGGAGSEALGQMSEGTGLEGLARLTGAIVGPMAASGATRAVQGAFRTAAERPSLEALKARKNASYKAVDDANIVISRSTLDDLYDKSVETVVATKNYLPQADEATNSALKLLNDLRSSPAGINLSQLDKVEQQLNRLYASAPNQVSILGMIDHIDQAMSSSGGGALMAAARADNRAFRKAQLIDNALENAKTRAASSGTGGNTVNKLRQAVAGILSNPRQLNYFTKQEIEAMTRIARGNLSENVLRAIGKLSPTSGGLMSALNIIHFGSAIMSPAALAGTAITVGSKKASEMLTERNLADLRQLFATGQMPVRTPAMAQRGALGLLPSVSTGLLGQ